MGSSNSEVIARPYDASQEPRADAANCAERVYRNALSRFPTGVAIVTTQGPDGCKYGITVNSFTSVSLRPPLVSFNLANSLQSLAVWLRAESFAINLLKDSQEQLSTGFARPNSDKWSNVEFVVGATANPILTPNLAHFECAKFACHQAGDHHIMIGEVIHFVAEGDDHPLIFYRGKYCRLVVSNDHASGD